MLLRVSVENFLSISDRQELSFVATKLKGPEESLRPVPNVPDLRVVPVAVIYGANASGKTNFVKAIRFLSRAVLLSHRLGSPDGGIPRIPFALGEDGQQRPTLLEADFLVDGIRYTYGFECDDHKFISEWLYAFPEGKRRKLFERKNDKVTFGQHFRGAKKALVEFMRPNSLFISTATQNDHEELSNIVSFFRSLYISNDVFVSEELIKGSFRSDKVDGRSISFLRSIGTGIVSYRQTEMELPDSVRQMRRNLHAVIRQHLGEDGAALPDLPEDDKDVVVELEHQGSGGKTYFLGLERESAGTRRLLLIMSPIFRALDSGSLVVIDELDASLHTRAAEMILEMFANPEINKNGAQLLATTHDTNMLSSKSLRRDQVWFCEKDKNGASHIYSLADFKVRSSDDYERGYLEGRFGAIPFSSSAVMRFV